MTAKRQERLRKQGRFASHRVTLRVCERRNRRHEMPIELRRRLVINGFGKAEHSW